MFSLKPLSREAVPAALERAERYRLLNEPWHAESICEDILRVEPHNQAAVRMLLLSLTDQFVHGINAQTALDALGRLDEEYDRLYYEGIIHERRASALLRQGDQRAGDVVYNLIREAMRCYERAEAKRTPGNDEAVLRWNTCVRMLQKMPYLQPARWERPEPILSE
jgi:hypothetical protein